MNHLLKNLIIMSNGENVSPEEIENKLALHPLISEVVITGENNGLTATRRLIWSLFVIPGTSFNQNAIRTITSSSLSGIPTAGRITTCLLSILLS